MALFKQSPEFVTATILEWKPLLKPDKYKILLLNSLRFMIERNRMILYSYVIMHNHIHLIWQMRGDVKSADVRRDFFKYTAQRMQYDLQLHHPNVLPHFASSQKDRQFQFWERNTLCVDLYTEKVFQQKMDYIHANPVKARFCVNEEDYLFSSARFYKEGHDAFNILTHFDNNLFV